jgi:hypothetical protein
VSPLSYTKNETAVMADANLRVRDAFNGIILLVVIFKRENF